MLKRIYLSLTFIGLLLVGCGQRPAHQEGLLAIDRLRFCHPDSVMMMLVEIEPRLANADDSAYFCVLYTEEITREGLSLAGDSAISRAIRYFSERDAADRELYVRALLARAQNSYLRSRWAEAMRDGMTARRACRSGDHILLLYANAVMGEVNLSADCFRQAISCFRQALAQVKQAPEDKNRIVRICNNMAEAYDRIGMRDSFTYYQRLTRPLYDSVSTRVKTELRVSEGDSYLRQGDLQRALACLEAVNGVDISKKSSFLLGNIYHRQHREREAEFMWFDAAGASSPVVRIAAIDSLLKYRPDDSLLKDLQIRTYKAAPSLGEADELVSMQQAEQQSWQQQRAYRRAVVTLSIICILLTGLLMLALYHRRQVRFFRRHIHDLNRRYLRDIEDYNRAKNEISRLRQRIAAYQDDSQQLRQWDMQDMLLGDDAVIALHRMASRGQIGQAEDWKELRAQVRAHDPRFWMALRRLPELSDRELHACLLIRLRFLPTELAALLAVSPQAVTNLRVRLLHKLFGISGGARDFDERIRNL
ncbi:MAG: hypothetical protein MR450_07885 [Prevotella sp.]|nr:hypothetical protein [Prevotella sp.]MDY4039661.1 hypothetical protein [Prevotella sp.]